MFVYASGRSGAGGKDLKTEMYIKIIWFRTLLPESTRNYSPYIKPYPHTTFLSI